MLFNFKFTIVVENSAKNNFGLFHVFFECECMVNNKNDKN